jgi:hypothetical protein
MTSTASTAMTTELSRVPIASLRETPENWTIYNRPAEEPEFLALIDSIRDHGIETPLHVSSDNYIVSGHRRHAAAIALGIEFGDAIRLDFAMGPKAPPERVAILIEHNRGSRVKTAAESIAETMAGIDPEEAIREARERKAKVYTMAQTSSSRVTVTTTGNRRTDPRAQRGELLDAVITILKDLRGREMLPTTGRHIHYKLLAGAPPVSKGRKGHPYGTDPKGDPGKLSKLLTDARSAGLIPHSWIADGTRGGHATRHCGTIGDYVAGETANLFGSYFYNVHEDQPAHIELLVEKNTMFELIMRHVAAPLRIPLTSGRGYASFPVGFAMKERFRKSGKDRLILITVCDHDPEGYDMPQAMKKYLKIDHGIVAEVHRAAITTEQIERYGLPPDIEAKETSARCKGYVEQTGLKDAWELDALEPELLIKEVDMACRSFLDIDAFNAAWKRENDADIKLAALRSALAKQVPSLMKEIEGALT